MWDKMGRREIVQPNRISRKFIILLPHKLVCRQPRAPPAIQILHDISVLRICSLTTFFFYIYQKWGKFGQEIYHHLPKFIVPSPSERNKLRQGGRNRQLSVVHIWTLPYSNLRSVPTRYKYNGD